MNPGDSRRHQAAKAWRRLGLPGGGPDRVEILTLKPKSAVYRLFGVGTNGSTVIAKQCRRDTGRVERMVYEEILPRLPLVGLEYHGFVADRENGDDWLFLGDAGEMEFSLQDEGHNLLAAEWLGTLHRLGREVPGAERLPARGPDYYLSQLRVARANILENIENPALTPQDRIVLRSVVARLTLAEGRWEDVESHCERAPRTVVHGDFCAKNIVVGVDGDRQVLFPLDWEMAGWGVPAIDLHVLDPRLYWSAVRESWPELEYRDVESLVRYGRLFRQIMGVSWGSVELNHEWVMETMYKMKVYDVRLGRSLESDVV
jgi:hypothetical protein